MKRIDLRKSKDLFLDMKKYLDSLKLNETALFLFEIGDFSNVEKSYEFVYKQGCVVLNSLKFNQVDWTICVKRENEL